MYFELIGSLTPKKGKGQFVFRPGTQSTTSVADVDGLHSIPPPISTAGSPSLNLEQLTVAVMSFLPSQQVCRCCICGQPSLATLNFVLPQSFATMLSMLHQLADCHVIAAVRSP